MRSRKIRAWRHRTKPAFGPAAIEPLESRTLLSLTAPTGVQATNGATPTDVEVTWSSVSGATSYEIWRNTTANTSSATDIAPSVTATPFDDTSVTVGTTYFYWVVASNGSSTSPYSTVASATGGTLVFDDTFGSDGVSSAWGAFNATDPNNGSVIYTNTTPSEATSSNPTTEAIVSDSAATDGQALAMTLQPSPSQSGDYDSAEICTEVDPSGLGNSLEYGEITARIKMPGGNNSGAIWPAFWMLGDDFSTGGWPNCGEIDIMESKGSAPGTNDSTIHGPQGGADYNGGEGVGSSYTLSGGQDFYSAYHVFSVNWGPNSISFSVDGTVFETLTPASLPTGGKWVFNGEPFFIILDVCEGGDFAPGTITSPQTMDVDYVRAYSLPPPGGIEAAIGTNTSPVEVNWNAITGATSYEVWRNTTSNTATATELVTSTANTSYTDNSATRGVDYYYWIVARNSAQTSGFSLAVITKFTPTVTTASPPSLIGYDGTTDVTNWATTTVTGVSGQPAPTGATTLVFYSGTSDTGTPLSSSPINLGTYTVVASYAGDSNYVAAQSSPVTFTIQNPTGLSTGPGAAYAFSGSPGAQTLTVTAGIVTLSADLSATFPNYSLTIQNGGSVLLESSQNVQQLQLLGNGRVDVSYYSMIIHYGAGSDPISTIRSYLISGNDDNTWDGSGITSSAAPYLSGFAVGYADGADGVVPGLPSGQIEVKWTLYGDANLDGVVNGTDFGILAANFGTQAPAWDNGDFNYDGVVNGSDFGLLSANFGKAASVPAIVPLSAPTLLTVAPSDNSTASKSSSSVLLQLKPTTVPGAAKAKAVSHNAKINHTKTAILIQPAARSG
jgi:beta-glucanase (GH16 family)